MATAEQLVEAAVDGGGRAAGETFVIEPRRSSGGARLAELWHYRRLLGYFGKRALEKRYARTKLGASWLFLRPVVSTGSRVLIFNGLLHAPGPAHVPYFLFFMFGMTVWELFDRTLYWATRSIELNRRLVTKLYFPRILLPFGVTLPGIVDFLVYLLMTTITVLGFWVVRGTLYLVVGPRLLAAVAGLALTLLLAWGIGLWTSVLGATTRDMRFTLSYLFSFWFLLTPVVYTLDSVPPHFRTLALLNPLSTPVELFKWGTIGAGDVRVGGLLYSCTVVLAVWLGGLWFFGRAEAGSIDQL